MKNFDFDSIKIDWSQVPEAPITPVFSDLSKRVIASLPQDDPPDVGKLASVLQELSKRCQESVVKNAFLIADWNPKGAVAWLLRKKIETVLPDQMKTVAIEDAIIKVGAWAARNNDVWTLIYPKESHA